MPTIKKPGGTAGSSVVGVGLVEGSMAFTGRRLAPLLLLTVWAGIVLLGVFRTAATACVVLVMAETAAPNDRRSRLKG